MIEISADYLFLLKKVKSVSFFILNLFYSINYNHERYFSIGIFYLKIYQIQPENSGWQLTRKFIKFFNYLK